MKSEKKPDKILEFVKPRTPKGEARYRERLLIQKMAELLQFDDEKTLIEALRKDFGIGPGHERYSLILRTWREQRR